MNNIQMQNIAIEELESVEGGVSFWGLLALGEGTLIACVAGGGWAGGGAGIALCAVGAALIEIGAVI